MNITRFDIAGVLIELHTELSPSRLGLDGSLGAFLASAGGAAARAVVRWCEGDARIPSCELVYDPGEIWRMYRSPGGDRFYAEVSYPSEPGSARSRALLTANRAWDDLLLIEERAGPEWRSLLTLGAGELILRTRILFAGGLVFHACGIDDRGRGLVFAGNSGAGKSTQAALWTEAPGVTVMNDDRVAVRVANGAATAYGTPWGGSQNIARNHRAPLAAIVVLEQGPDNVLEPLSRSAAIPLLLARAFLPYWDAALMERALDVMEALVDRAPVYRLRCRPEPAVIDLVRSVL